MKGNFSTKDECIKNLRNQGFLFYCISDDGLTYFYKKSESEIAEINVYNDGSSSALIGKFNNIDN